MKLAALVLCALVATSAFASQPGQPQDCSDWVLLRTGIACRVGIPFPCQAPDLNALAECSSTNASSTLDLDGAVIWYRWLPLPDSPPCPPSSLMRVEIVRSVRGADEVVAYLDMRCDPDTQVPDRFGTDGVRMDGTNGRLHLPMYHEGASYNGNTLFFFEGFTASYDLLQSYQPDQIGFRVSVMPNGFRAADHFDSYWGPLGAPVDLSTAHPFQCGYPATLPAPGDFLQITAPVPTPAPGCANYVLTSVTYEGQTRAGRKVVNGRLVGRDATALPACVIEEVKR